MEWGDMQHIKNRFSVNHIIRLFIWIILIAIYIPYLWAARYAIFSSDDFAFYNATIIRNGSSWTEKVIIETIRCYKEWQGTHTSTFLLQLLNPLYPYSYRLLHILLLGMLLATFIGIIFLSNMISEYCLSDRKYGLYFASGILIPLLSYRDYKEIYLWYTGIMAYLLPVLFFSFGFAFLLAGEIKHKKSATIVGGFFMLLMSGGVLEFVGVGTFCLVILILVDYFRNHKLNWNFLKVFMLTLLGDLANALAPGNFVRKKAIGDEGIDIISAVVTTLKTTFEETEWIYRNTTFFVFVIIAFLIGYHMRTHTKPLIVAISIVGLIALPIVTVFPVAIGYGDIAASTLPGRCLFIMDASIMVSGIGIAVFVGNRLRVSSLMPEIRTVRFVLSLAIILVIMVQGNSLSGYTPVAISVNLKSGIIRDFSSGWRDIFEEIRVSDQEDVIVTGKPQETAGCLSPAVREDPDWWVNKNVAEFYGKNSVCVIE